MADTSARRAFVIGYPVAHSRSPLIHGTWLSAYGLAGSYRAVAVAPTELGPFIGSLRDGSSPFIGGNVTIPHKEDVLQLADRCTGEAEAIGAANTLWIEAGLLVASNTDKYGFLANLDQRAAGWEGERRSAVVLGAGGASRAVVAGLRERDFAAIHVVNRTHARARVLADGFGPTVHGHGWDGLSAAMRGADIFVNTTALGMDGTPAPAIDFTGLAPHGLVTDIVYVPLVTPILAMAARQGRRTVDGLGMLLHQAVPGFERWFGVRPEVTEDLRRRIVADLEQHA